MGKRKIAFVSILGMIAAAVIISILMLINVAGIKPAADISASKLYSLDEAVTKVFYVEEVGSFRKVADATEWLLNGDYLGIGQSIRIKYPSRLSVGDNLLVALNGTDVVVYTVSITPYSEFLPYNTVGELQNALCLSFNNEHGMIEWDELDSFSPRDYIKAALDETDALNTDGSYSLQQGNAVLHVASVSNYDHLYVMLMPTFHNLLGNTPNVSVAGLKRNVSAVLQFTFDAGTYNVPVIMKFDPIGAHMPLETERTNSTTVSASMKENGTYFLFDAAALTKTDLADLAYTEIALVIDMSGSMYSSDQWIAFGFNPDMENLDSIAQDVEFKRVELMVALVNALSEYEARNEGRFKYSVSAFTADYHVVTNMSDAKTTIDSLNKLRESNYKFSGTAIQNAINSAAHNAFNPNLIGTKLIICLTDGTEGSSRNTNPSQYMINNSIDLVMVGLGTGADFGLINQLAQETNGIALFADDADALDKLLDRILAKARVGAIENVILTTGERAVEETGLILADSGFRASVDGFPFANFATASSPGGNSYGFSITAKMIYEGINANNDFYRLGLTSIRDESAVIWALERGYPYIFPSPGLTSRAYSSLLAGNVYTNTSWVELDASLLKRSPSIEYEVQGDTLVIPPGQRQYWEENGYIIVMDYSFISIGDVIYAGFERVYRDVFSTGINDQDSLSILALISHNQLTQLEAIAANKPLISEITGMDQIAALISHLGESKPVILNMRSSQGNHAVLATKITQDITNSEVFYIYIYDSNEPGGESIMKLELAPSVYQGNIEYRFGFSGYSAGIYYNKVGYYRDMIVYEGIPSLTDYVPQKQIAFNLQQPWQPAVVETVFYQDSITLQSDFS